MKASRTSLLLHPLFILSLFVLLVNDVSLKYEFPNLLTGKLSDFAGLFAFSIFWLCLFPAYRTHIIIGIALFFFWWKSPFSMSFIESWNQWIPLKLARVVDYTDLAALIVLPYAYKLTGQPYNRPIRHRRALVFLTGGISIFAFCFTSAPRYALYNSRPDEINFYGHFTSSRSETEILSRLSALHYTVIKDSTHFYPLDSEDYFLRVSEPGTDSTRWIRINNQDTALYMRATGRSFYLIHQYEFDGHKIRNLRISIDQAEKNTFILVRAQQWGGEPYSGKLRREYKRHFKNLFK